jgi:hydrogenase maturation protein HypF
MKREIILSLGGDIKNRTAVLDGSRLVLGPEVGDLGLHENFERFKRGIGRLLDAVGGDISVIAHDKHPGYCSMGYARELAGRLPDVKLFAVQHHVAHVMSVLYEHRIKGAVIGVAFDGTGYGDDGNMWGGEIFVIKDGWYKRAAHLKYRMLPGGDTVVREPWRMALSIMGKTGVQYLKGVDKRAVGIVMRQMEKKVNCPLSSSAGRLFDGAAALLGMAPYASYEAEGPIKLERIADPAEDGGYEFIVDNINGIYEIDTDGLFKGMAGDLKKKTPVPVISARYHNTVAEAVSVTVERIGMDSGIKTVALSGGVFQNRILRDKIPGMLEARGFTVITNREYPVNDSNIAIGQCHTARRFM